MGLKNLIQLTRARRLYKNNPDARAELIVLGDRADADPDMSEAQYLAAEAQIIRKYRRQ